MPSLQSPPQKNTTVKKTAHVTQSFPQTFLNFEQEKKAQSDRRKYI